MEDRVKIIQALLAKAEDSAATEPERETYRAKAFDLMIRWEIDELTARGEERRLAVEQIVDEKYIVTGPKIYLEDLVNLVFMVAGCHSVTVYIVRSRVNPTTNTYERGSRTSYATLVGFRDDVDRLRPLLDSLVRQCVQALTSYRPTGSSTERFKARRGFIIGYGRQLRERIIAVRDHAINTHGTTGTALALRDKSSLVAEWISANITHGRAKIRVFDTHGIRAGRVAGLSADIGQTAAGTGTTRILEK